MMLGKNSTIRELHDKAIVYYNEGLIAEHNNDLSKMYKLLGKALEAETAAAQKLEAKQEYEPTRSILYRSAASIAHKANKTSLCKRLAAHGLCGFPDSETEEELLALVSGAKLINIKNRSGESNEA